MPPTCSTSTRMAMVARGRRDRRPSAAGARAGRASSPGRAAPRRSRAADAVAQPGRRVRGRAAQDARPDGHQLGRAATSAGRCSTPSTSRPTSSSAASRRAAAWPGRTTLADLGGRAAPTSRRRPSRCPSRRPVASRGCPTRASPGSAPTASRTCSRRAIAKRDPGPVRSRRRRRRRTGSTSTPRWPATASALARPAAARPSARRVAGPRPATPVPLDEVEDARSIARRFVVSAMSVGALSRPRRTRR